VQDDGVGAVNQSPAAGNHTVREVGISSRGQFLIEAT
jgi:hypothetical protein